MAAKKATKKLRKGTKMGSRKNPDVLKVKPW